MEAVNKSVLKSDNLNVTPTSTLQSQKMRPVARHAPKAIYRKFRAEEALLKQTIEKQMQTLFLSKQLEAEEYIKGFISKYSLPADVEISFDASTGKSTAIWRDAKNIDLFREKYPIAFHRDDWLLCPVKKVKLEFSSIDQPILLETVFFGKTGWGKMFEPTFLVQKGAFSCEGDHLVAHITEVLTDNSLEAYKIYGW